MEDLWPFNEEIVARTIYDSEIPIISAVGHETDFTIADFVADLRAPTPSAAAELAVTDIADLKYTLDLYEKRLKMSLKRKTETMRLRYEKCMNSKVYKDPLQKVNENYLILDKYIKSLENIMVKKLKDCRLNFEKEISKLDALSPLKTLSRGYSLTTLAKTNKIIKSYKEVKSGDGLKIRFSDGAVEAIVK